VSYLTYSLIVPVILLAGAGYLHIKNLDRIHVRIEKLAGGRVPKKDLYREITVAQGTNFTALANAALIMLAVALAYLYLLVPNNLSLSYMMRMPGWASSPIGFALFGAIIAILTAILILASDSLSENHRSLKLTELYSFYVIPKGEKKKIGLSIIFLAFSIFFSAWIGTIYPMHNNLLEGLSFALLLLAILLLVLPIWEGRK
jgi:hypothetical protein